MRIDSHYNKTFPHSAQKRSCYSHPWNGATPLTPPRCSGWLRRAPRHRQSRMHPRPTVCGITRTAEPVRADSVTHVRSGHAGQSSTTGLRNFSIFSLPKELVKGSIVKLVRIRMSFHDKAPIHGSSAKLPQKDKGLIGLHHRVALPHCPVPNMLAEDTIEVQLAINTESGPILIDCANLANISDIDALSRHYYLLKERSPCFIRGEIQRVCLEFHGPI